MIGYRDMTFCGFWRTCGAIKERRCERPLTEAVEFNAQRLGLMVAQFIEKPECHRERDAP